MEFRYTGGYFCVGTAFRGLFRYPVGGAFGDFYENVAAACREWAEREYSEYTGRMLTYRFSARVTDNDDDGAAVFCEFVLSEKGSGSVARNTFAHRWSMNGRVAREGIGKNIQNAQETVRK
ncbi:MAG: hypothetical protein IJX46_05995 [Clostridia bacterium]|nr:hypothetical protein [Clostridia bacterium]